MSSPTHDPCGGPASVNFSAFVYLLNAGIIPSESDPDVWVQVFEPLSGRVIHSEMLNRRIPFRELNRDTLHAALRTVAQLFTTGHSSVVEVYERYIDVLVSEIRQYQENLGTAEQD